MKIKTPKKKYTIPPVAGFDSILNKTRGHEVVKFITDDDPKFLAFHSEPLVIDATVNDIDSEFVKAVHMVSITGFGTHYEEVIMHVLKKIDEVQSLNRDKIKWYIKNDRIEITRSINESYIEIANISPLGIMGMTDNDRFNIKHKFWGKLIYSKKFYSRLFLMWAGAAIFGTLIGIAISNFNV